MRKELREQLRDFNVAQGDRDDPVAQACRRFFLRVEGCPRLGQPVCRQCRQDEAAIERAWDATEEIR